MIFQRKCPGNAEEKCPEFCPLSSEVNLNGGYFILIEITVILIFSKQANNKKARYVQRAQKLLLLSESN